MTLDAGAAAVVLRAIETFLRLAYPEGAVPAPRRAYLDLDVNSPRLASQLLEMPGAHVVANGPPTDSICYAFRLGNARYPHMKVLAKLCDVPEGVVIAVDKHDEFPKVPPDHPEYQAIQDLRQFNRDLARDIEQAWAALGLPTQATVLRDYLSHRSVAGPSS